MNWHSPWLLSFALFACGQPSHAELQLDPSMEPKQVEKLVTPLLKSVVTPYGDAHSADFGGPYGKKGTFWHYDDKFAWTFKGKRFLSTIGSFNPEIVPLADCKPSPDELNPGDRCEWRRERFNVCHLFMFNGNNLKFESVTRLNIARDKKKLLGLPRCDGIEAMAVAKTIPDEMIITIRYMDSAEPADPRNDPPWFYSTVLLRFSDDNGKLKIVQDDNCLGNPNKYKTITAARKALARCSAK